VGVRGAVRGSRGCGPAARGLTAVFAMLSGAQFDHNIQIQKVLLLKGFSWFFACIHRLSTNAETRSLRIGNLDYGKRIKISGCSWGSIPDRG
jgi:hypothetical protein